MSTADLQRGLEGVRNGEIVSFLIYRPARDGAGTTAVVNVRAREAR